MNKPLPLTATPDDPDSPKGAIPVDIYGIEGGGGADIDWANINVPGVTFNTDWTSLVTSGTTYVYSGDSTEIDSTANSMLRGNNAASIGSKGTYVQVTGDVGVSIASVTENTQNYLPISLEGSEVNVRGLQNDLVTEINNLKARLDALEP